MSEQLTVAVAYLLAHWPALTTPLPWISNISLLGLVKASSLRKINDCGSWLSLCDKMLEFTEVTMTSIVLLVCALSSALSLSREVDRPRLLSPKPIE